MAQCLIALGSNLGHRSGLLRQAVAALDGACKTRVVARSVWHETAPVGGPTGQGAFLNGVVRVATGLDCAAMFAEMVRIERSLGRIRNEAWGPRTIDLDLLLYGDEAGVGDSVDVKQRVIGVGDASHKLVVPHPRMHVRRFVLEPAVEAGPWMIHPTSGWTVAQLLAQLAAPAQRVAVAAAAPAIADELAARLNERCAGCENARPRVERWDGGGWNPGPNVLVAVSPLPGGEERQWRKMLSLPAYGPVTWVGEGPADAMADEAWTAIISAWPELAAAK